MIRRAFTTTGAALCLALACAASAAAHEFAAADLGGGGPDGVPNRVERALGGKVTPLDDGLYRVRSKDGYAYTTHGPDFGGDLEPVESHGGDIDPGDAQRGPRCIANPATDYYQEVLYAYPSYGTNDVAAKEVAIEGIIGRMNAVLNEESLASGGQTADYKVRCDGDGTVKVSAFSVPLSSGTNPTFTNIVNAAQSAGYSNQRVDYTIFYDGTGPGGACGTGYLWNDDSLSAGNYNNNPGGGVGAGYGATYGGCWYGRTPIHENGHNQGAVQYNAPDSTGNGGHCNEAADVMCYLDGGNLNQNYPQPCAIAPSTLHFDCGWDSYFDAAPEAGEWLATHWNIGSTLNRFIAFGGPTADFTPSCAANSCTFTDASSATAGIASRSWTFGDGATSTATNPSHAYAASRAYAVTLTVTDTNGAVGSVTKTIALNNPFGNPQLLSGNSVTVNGSNSGADKETGEPNHAGFPGGASVWYRWTANASGAVSIDTCGSNIDTLLAVYTGSAVGSLTQIASNDDANPACSSGARQSALSFTASAGATYQIAVDGYNAAKGEITLRLTSAGDSTPPETTITSGPSGPTNDASPSFGFSSNEAGSTFECKLDSGSLAACTSPQSYASLADGPHTFTVAATDPAANVDPTPATRSFVVDTVAPDTQITDGPSGTIETVNTQFSFALAGSDATATSFECRLDGGAYAACSSPAPLSGLAEGSHTFYVRARDAAGNLDGTPASRSFTVDVPDPPPGEAGDKTPPETTITAKPPAKLKVRRKARVAFSFSANEDGSGFECSLDGKAFSSCASPATYRLKPGRHEFRVRAIDAVGNADESPASYSFRVKKKRRRR